MCNTIQNTFNADCVTALLISVEKWNAEFDSLGRWDYYTLHYRESGSLVYRSQAAP